MLALLLLLIGQGASLGEASGLTASTASFPLLTATIQSEPMSNSLVVGSTNVVTVKGLKDVESGLYLDDATVILAALLDTAGATVTGTANIPMPYIGGTGRSVKYRGVIPHTVPLVAGATYTRRFSATDTNGDVRLFDRPITAEAG